MTRRWKLIVVNALALVLVLGVFSAEKALSAEPIVIKYADPSKADTARTRAAADTMSEIEKRTGGKVKHELYWSESLLKAKDILKGIQAGLADVGDPTAIPYHPARFPVWQFIQLLFIGGKDPFAVTKACNELYDTLPVLKEEYESQGLKMLTTSSLTPTVISSAKPLRSPEDFKGLKIRAIGPVAKWVAAMGGVPSPIPIYETSEALARGVIHGTQSYIYASHAYKFYEQCKFQPLDSISHIFVEYVINQDTLKKMSPDIQKIYLDTWRDFYLDRFIKYTDEELDQQIKDFKEAGVEVYSLKADELAGWRKASESINEEYYKNMEKAGVDGKKLVDQYQALYDKFARKR